MRRPSFSRFFLTFFDFFRLLYCLVALLYCYHFVTIDNHSSMNNRYHIVILHCVHVCIHCIIAHCACIHSLHLFTHCIIASSASLHSVHAYTYVRIYPYVHMINPHPCIYAYVHMINPHAVCLLTVSCYRTFIRLTCLSTFYSYRYIIVTIVRCAPFSALLPPYPYRCTNL